MTFAFGVMPVTIFFGAFCGVLLYVGVLQLLFEHVGSALGNLMGISPAEGDRFRSLHTSREEANGIGHGQDQARVTATPVPCL